MNKKLIFKTVLTCKVNGKTVKIVEEVYPEEKITTIAYGKKQYTSVSKNREIVGVRVKINQDEYGYKIDKDGNMVTSDVNPTVTFLQINKVMKSPEFNYALTILDSTKKNTPVMNDDLNIIQLERTATYEYSEKRVKHSYSYTLKEAFIYSKQILRITMEDISTVDKFIVRREPAIFSPDKYEFHNPETMKTTSFEGCDVALNPEIAETCNKIRSATAPLRELVLKSSKKEINTQDLTQTLKKIEKNHVK